MDVLSCKCPRSCGTGASFFPAPPLARARALRGDPVRHITPVRPVAPRPARSRAPLVVPPRASAILRRPPRTRRAPPAAGDASRARCSLWWRAARANTTARARPGQGPRGPRASFFFPNRAASARPCGERARLSGPGHRHLRLLAPQKWEWGGSTAPQPGGGSGSSARTARRSPDDSLRVASSSSSKQDSRVDIFQGFGPGRGGGSRSQLSFRLPASYFWGSPPSGAPNPN